MSNKEILLELLKQSLGERLSKLEKNEKAEDASLKLIKSSYEGFSKQISFLVKLREEKINKEKSEEQKKNINKQHIDTGKNKKKEINQKIVKKQSAMITKKSIDKIQEKKTITNNIISKTKSNANLVKNPPTTRPRGKSHIRLNTEISRNTIAINPVGNNIKKKLLEKK